MSYLEFHQMAIHLKRIHQTHAYIHRTWQARLKR